MDFVSKIKDNRGGARPGTGPKKVKKTYSEAVKNNYIKAAKKLARVNGSTVEEQVLRMVYDKDVQDSVRISAAKVYNDALLIRESEQTINTNDGAPRIYLPKQDEDPALKVIKGGK